MSIFDSDNSMDNDISAIQASEDVSEQLPDVENISDAASSEFKQSDDSEVIQRPRHSETYSSDESDDDFHHAKKSITEEDIDIYMDPELYGLRRSGRARGEFAVIFALTSG